MTQEKPFVVRTLTEAESKARKRRNLWLALSLFSFVLIVLAITMVRLSQNIAGNAAGG